MRAAVRDVMRGFLLCGFGAGTGRAARARAWSTVARRGSRRHARFLALRLPVRLRAALRRCTATGLTELVGREEELELLLRRWSKAKGGQVQVVLLSGEPGIGKS